MAFVPWPMTQKQFVDTLGYRFRLILDIIFLISKQPFIISLNKAYRRELNLIMLTAIGILNKETYFESIYKPYP